MYLKSGISSYMTKFQLYTQHCIQRKLLILGIYTFKTRNFERKETTLRKIIEINTVSDNVPLEKQKPYVTYIGLI